MPAQIIENCQTYPVFSDRRLVIVRDSGLFRSGGRATLPATPTRMEERRRGHRKGKRGDELSGFLQDLPEHVCLVFIEKEIDRRSKYVRLAEKHGLVVQFDFRKPDELTGWVIRKLREMKHDASPRTA